jgi:GH24 family phage-related lysozyme (muramidase)
MKMVSKKAKQLILSFEGLDKPSKWPGGASGITVGIGYDLGYENEEEFREDWSSYLSDEQLDRLSTAIGKRGEEAKTIASQFSDIVIKRDDAEAVFNQRSLPKYEEQARDAFPGFDDLPSDTQGALVSLVFNRGPSMKGDGRIEMRAIRDLVANYKESSQVKLDEGETCTLQKIADQIRAMKRLWVGKGLDGLLSRRDGEADLVESCIGEVPALNVMSISSSRGNIFDIIISMIKSIFGK